MVRKKNDAAGEVVQIYFPKNEYEKIVEEFKHSTCQSFSEYVRTMMTKRSVTVRVRNESLERYLEIAVDLKNELRSLVEGGGGEEARELAGVIYQLMLKIYKECTQL